MKKTFKASRIVLTMILSMSLITFAPATVANATTINKTDGTASNNSFTGEGNAASLSVHANITAADVISCDISWGTLVFSYATSGWDPANLASNGEGAWIAQTTGVSDKITVDNRSNVPVTASFAYVPEESAANYADVEGTLTPASVNLETHNKLGGALEANRKKSTVLSLAGDPTDTTPRASFTTIGYVTISIAKTPEAPAPAPEPEP